MAGFGGSIKLTGANEYKKSLQDITQNLKVITAEMKAMSSGFDAGTTSEEQLAAASKELKTALDNQKDALAKAKDKLSELVDSYGKAKEKHQQLVDEYEKERRKLDDIRDTLGESSDEYKNQEKVVADLENQVKKSATEYEKLGKDVNDAKIKIANAETTINTTTEALEDLGDEAEDAGDKAEKSGDGFTIMKGVLSDLASKAIQSVIDGLKKMGDAVVDVGKQALDGYSKFEQLEGGVKKIFGDDVAQTVMDNADKAFSTAGMSANDYMETVTGFAASLVSSLAGDTELAAAFADEAIRDMSDNANVFGTNMETIQAAYSGFSRGQFQMLDSLKLGYGGTKEEMERLLQDAAELEGYELDAFSVNNFADIIDAIHIVQENMNITGTTAKEAASTIEGSTASMKAAWENLLVGIASEDADISKLTDSLIDQVVAMGKNMIPRIKVIIKGIGELVSSVWNEVIPELAKEFPELKPITDALLWVKDNADMIISALSGILAGFVAFKSITFFSNLADNAMMLFSTIKNGVPIMQALTGILGANPAVMIIAGVVGLTAAIVTLWNTSEDFRNFFTGAFEDVKNTAENVTTAVSGFFKEKLPKAFKEVKDKALSMKNDLVAFFKEIPSKASDMVTKTVDFFKKLPYNIGIIIGETLGYITKFVGDAWMTLSTKVPEIIDNTVNFFKELPGKIWSWLQETLNKFGTFASEAISKAKEAGNQFVSKLVGIIKDLPDKVWTWLSSTLIKIGSFVSEAASKAAEAGKSLFNNIVNEIKNLPETMKEVGKNLVEGLWNGITSMGKWLQGKIKEFANGIMDGMKKSLQISSPSKRARDLIGVNIAKGVGVGFENEMKTVSANMNSNITSGLQAATNISNAPTSSGVNFSYGEMVNAFKDALYQVKIEMDDTEMGRFVDKTVTNLVYT